MEKTRGTKAWRQRESGLCGEQSELMGLEQDK